MTAFGQESTCVVNVRVCGGKFEGDIQMMLRLIEVVAAQSVESPRKFLLEFGRDNHGEASVSCGSERTWVGSLIVVGLRERRSGVSRSRKGGLWTGCLTLSGRKKIYG